MHTKIIFNLSVLLLCSSVWASPEALQRLYDTPHSGDHGHYAHDHHAHDHHSHDHHVHEEDHGHASGHVSAGSESISGVDAGGVESGAFLFDSEGSPDISVNGQDHFNPTRLGKPADGSSSNAIHDSFKKLPTASFGVTGFGNDGRGKSVQQLVEDAQSTEQSNEDSHNFVFGTQPGRVALDGSLNNGNLAALEVARGLNAPSYEDLTITVEVTKDVYTTFTNTIYNSVPVTLTQFLKSTNILPTVQVAGTPVDDKVLVSTAPVTRTDTVFVTDTNTAYQYVTEVSTDIYTITHRAYDIQQQVVSSTLVQTKVIRPTIVSTVIFTEVETSTVSQTVTNTVVVEPRFASTRLPNLQALDDLVINGNSLEDEEAFLRTLRRNHVFLLSNVQDLIKEAAKHPSLTTLLAKLLELSSQLNNSVQLSLVDREIFQANLADRLRAHAEELRNFYSRSGQTATFLRGSQSFLPSGSGETYNGPHHYY